VNTQGGCRAVCSHVHSMVTFGITDDAVLCCAVLCCAVLCCAVLCCAVLCCPGVETLGGKYELHDLVQLDAHTAGVIVGIDKDTARVLTNQSTLQKNDIRLCRVSGSAVRCGGQLRRMRWAVEQNHFWTLAIRTQGIHVCVQQEWLETHSTSGSFLTSDDSHCAVLWSAAPPGTCMPLSICADTASHHAVAGL